MHQLRIRIGHAGAAACPRTRVISYGADLPVAPDEAFTFVSDPATWPRFFASVVSATADQGWGHVGGCGYIVTRFLGRIVTSQMLLTEWDPPHTFRYTARQAARPDLDNRRLFEAVPGGTRLQGTTELALRPGAKGLLDCASAQVLQRVYDQAMARLADVIIETGQAG
jgi:hypothetical protein